MRRGLWLGLLVIVISLVQAGAFADTSTTFTGRALDPHGNPISDYLVYAKFGQTYQVTTRTDAAGRFTLTAPTQSGANCWIIGGSPDEFYTQSSGGKLCASGTTDVRPLYRIRSQATPKETYVPALGTIPYHFEVYANSRSNPAPYAGDALTWTLTYHTIGGTEKSIYSQGVFPTPVATRSTDGSWRYVWKMDVAPVVTKPTMIHVDWGDASNFGQMMDCRMIFAGVGLQPRSSNVYTPGSTVTLDGNGFGASEGKILFEQTSSLTWVDHNLILEWTNTRISFLLPPTITSNSYVRVFRADGQAPWCMPSAPGLPTNKIPLRIKVI